LFQLSVLESLVEVGCNMSDTIDSGQPISLPSNFFGL